jgi:hypothetical protein
MNQDDPWIDTLRTEYQPDMEVMSTQQDDFHQAVMGRMKRRRVLVASAVSACVILVGIFATNLDPKTGETQGQMADAKSSVTTKQGIENEAFLDSLAALDTQTETEVEFWSETGSEAIQGPDLDDYLAGDLASQAVEDWTASAQFAGGDLNAIAQLITIIDTQETL